jgi:uncharacterized protein
MSYSLYDLSVSLSHILKKAEAFAKQQGIQPGVFVDATLYPDMMPLSFQIQIVTSMAVSSVARITGVEPVTFENNEKTLGELQERIAKCIEYLSSVNPEGFAGQDDKRVAYPTMDPQLHFSARDYLIDLMVPNVQFHMVTAYNILRHFGVPIGKRDYLAGYIPEVLQ